MRRLLTLFALALAAGIATTFVIAWSCAWLADPDPQHTRSAMWSLPGGRGAGLRLHRGRFIEGLSVYSSMGLPSEQELTMMEQMLEGLSPRQKRQTRQALRAAAGRTTFLSAGWPRPALRGEFDSNGRRRGAISIGSAAGNPGDLARALPLLPTWPGFAVNSAMSIAFWTLALVAPAIATNIRRRSAGRCLRCGYDLRGAPVGSRCPECGSLTATQKHREALPTEAPRDT